MKEGDLVGNYHLVREIGRGGMGTVFEVTEQGTENIYALKVCTERDEESQRRFRREVRIMTKINHPNVRECKSLRVNRHYKTSDNLSP